MLIHDFTLHPEGQGLIKAIKLALEEAEISPEQVATSMLTERQLLLMKKRRKWCDHWLFLVKEVPVSSTKSLLGHLLGAAGAVGSYRHNRGYAS